MPTPAPPFDWEKRADYDWTSPAGLALMQDKISEKLAFTPHPFQLNCSAKILNGTDVVCITATGDGKSALIYIPTMIREGIISLVVAPTNFLEADMVNNLLRKGLSAVAINSETLAAADLAKPPRNLWAEHQEKPRLLINDYKLQCEGICSLSAEISYN